MKRKKMNRPTLPQNRYGMGTVEIVIIIAILVALALIFRVAIMNYSSEIMSHVFDHDQVIEALGT